MIERFFENQGDEDNRKSEFGDALKGENPGADSFPDDEQKAGKVDDLVDYGPEIQEERNAKIKDETVKMPEGKDWRDEAALLHNPLKGDSGDIAHVNDAREKRGFFDWIRRKK